MAVKYEPYVYVDLGALRDAALDDGDAADEVAFGSDTHCSSHSKVLLLVTSRGIELIRIPKVLH